ncbi:MAG: stage III sporulation protein AF [Clostridia bacterium]|nr:stage III sporulation protein AF [Clostridia bacterium]
MNAWLLSIVGVVSLGVLLEILLADGETSKYIKGVFALAVVLVLVAPIPKFLNKDFDINEFFGEEMATQTTFLQSVNERRNAERESKVLSELKKANITAEKVRIFYLRGNLDDIDVVKVYLKADSDNNKVIEFVSEKIGCDKNKINIYSS